MGRATADPALVGVGLPEHELRLWADAEPDLGGPPGAATRDALAGQAEAASRFFRIGQHLLDRLPPPASRGDRERAAAASLHDALRGTRRRFLRRYGAPLYAALTQDLTRFVRVEDLVYAAAQEVPGLVPSPEQIAAERRHPQKDKEGFEIDQGLFLSQVLSLPREGLHLVWSMLRPLPESLDRLGEFQQTGRVQVGQTVVERRGPVGFLYHANPRFLNAEDDGVIRGLEVGTDLILLDPRVEVGVLRGQPVEHPKYAGRRVFNAGINLTHLYHGQIGFVDFFVVRDMGYLHKMYRGLAGPEFWPEAVEETHEKPWVAAVETFAIGGGCQLLLAMDHVLAERSAYFNLPARKEGIIPGVSNMRLWRFVGDRSARQAILFDRAFAADSPAGRLICDRVVEDGQMDAALDEALEALTSSGVVSAAGNRKAMRVGQESLDQFRQYLALYCREQAQCHYSPALIRNLERHWQAHRRAL